MQTAKPITAVAFIALITSTALANAPETSLRPVLRPDGLFTAMSPKPVLKPDELAALVAGEAPDAGDPNETSQSVREGEIVMDAENTEPTLEDDDVQPTAPGQSPEVSRPTVPEAPLEPFEPVSPSFPVPEPAAPIMPPELDLARYERETFGEDRARLLSDLSNKSENVFERLLARLNLGEFFLSHLMVPEGLSAVDDIPRGALPESDALRLDAVTDALEAASGEAGSEFTILGDDTYADWEGFNYWNAIRHLTRGDFEAAKPHLEPAFAAIKSQPDVHKEAFLKDILEGAIETGSWTLARTVAEHFSEHPDLQDTSGFNFLLGRAAQRIGRDLEAFDAFREASLGDDSYAQRARLAIVDIGMRTGAMPLEDAETFLEENIPSWQGDQLEVDALERLFEVSRELDKPVEALLALSQIFRGFPESDEAESYRPAAQEMLSDLYSKGRERDMTLSDFSAAHRQLSGPYQYFPGFDAAHMQYADLLRDMSATSAAAKEYLEIAERLDVANELDILPVDPDTVNEAYLRRAEALVAGSRFEQALTALVGPEASENPEIRDRALELKAAAYDNLGQGDDVLSIEPQTRTPRLLRLRADAYGIKQQWPDVVNTLNEIRTEHPEELTKRDASKLLLAAHRSGDRDTIEAVLTEYPDIFETDAFRSIAEGMSYMSAPLAPLKRETAEDRLRGAQQALDDVSETVTPDANQEQ